jgi:AAA domain (dynein-related subfamily)
MALLSTIAGTNIETGHTYRVTYSGNRPRHDGAIWRFTHGGRASRDDQGNLVPSAHGEIVWHSNDSIVEKFKNEDPYLSAKFQGTIEEVDVALCVGYENGAVLCDRKVTYDANRNRTQGPALVIRDVPVFGDARCPTCEQEQQQWEVTQATHARQTSIDDGLAAAIARRQSPAATAVQAGPVIVQQRETVEITAAGDDHPLAHLIPAYSCYENYISREIHGKRDIDILDSLAERGLNFLTEGPTESGKTALIKAWCALRRIPLVTVPCHGGIDATTIFSTKTLIGGEVATVLSNVTKALQHGPSVINFDEINFAPQKVTAVLHEALDDRRQVSLADLGYETFPVHPQCFIVASYNGGNGYAGTVELNEATKRRFKQLTWDYDDVVERKLISKLPVLHTIKEQIRKLISAGDVETPLGPAKLLQFEDDAVVLNLDLAIQFFVDSFKEGQERESLAEIFLHHRHQLEQELSAIQVAS